MQSSLQDATLRLVSLRMQSSYPPRTIAQVLVSPAQEQRGAFDKELGRGKGGLMGGNVLTDGAIPVGASRAETRHRGHDLLPTCFLNQLLRLSWWRAVIHRYRVSWQPLEVAALCRE
jgi:hypothetical protein